MWHAQLFAWRLHSCGTNDKAARIRHWLLNFCMIICSTVLSLILIEVMSGMVLYYGDAKVLHAFNNLGKEAHLIDPNKEASLRRIIQLSDNPRIIYELIPNVRALFVSRHISINSDGFRGPENYSRQFDQIKRIVGLGDSLMFGWGVNDDEHFLALLAGYLNGLPPDGYRWEIVNTAVPGYNAVMEVETLKAKGLHLRPDLVIMAFVVNGLSLPNFIRKEENYLTLQKSFVLNHLA